jgi:hypothetical protein
VWARQGLGIEQAIEFLFQPSIFSCFELLSSLARLLAFFVTANVALLISNFSPMPIEKNGMDDEDQEEQNDQPMKWREFAHAHPAISENTIVRRYY